MGMLRDFARYHGFTIHVDEDGSFIASDQQGEKARKPSFESLKRHLREKYAVPTCAIKAMELSYHEESLEERTVVGVTRDGCLLTDKGGTYRRLYFFDQERMNDINTMACQIEGLRKAINNLVRNTLTPIEVKDVLAALDAAGPTKREG